MIEIDKTSEKLLFKATSHAVDFFDGYVLIACLIAIVEIVFQTI